MAYVTKTINGTTSSSSLWTFKVVVTETAIDTTNKTSTVKLEAFLGRKSGVGSSYFAGTYKLNLSINNDTYKYSESLYKNATVSDGGYVSLGSATFVVTQTTTPLTVTVNSSMSTSSFNPNSASISATSVTLTKLHEAPLLGGDITWTETNTLLDGTDIDNNCFVTHLSKKTGKIPAITYDDSTVTEYRIINESVTYKSSTDTVTIDLTKNPLYVFYEPQQKQYIPKLYVGFTDSTGATSQWAYPSTTYIPYEKPSLKATASSVKRNGQISGKAKLNLTASIYPGVGSKTNTATLTFRYWVSGGTKPSTSYTIPTSAYTINNGKLTITNWDIAKNGTVVEDLDKSSSYKFEITITDAFGYSDTIELTCPKGEWLRAIFKDRIDFKKITQGGVQVATTNDIQRHIVSACLSSDYIDSYAAWSGKRVPFDAINMVGDKLMYDTTNNCVVVGAGVSKVRVTGSIFYCGRASDDSSATIMSAEQLRLFCEFYDKDGIGKGGSYTTPSYMYNSGKGVNIMVPMPERILDVNEGDTIRLSAQVSSNTTVCLLSRGTTLLVEVIE